MASALKGLKAEALTTEALPKLLLRFLPHFWGSFETRWEKGKTHLVPVIMHGWDASDYTLCGKSSSEHDSQDGGELLSDQPIPAYVCKKCQQVARQRGYGTNP